MFRRLVRNAVDAKALVQLHPRELSGLLEQAWNLRVHDTGNNKHATGHPNHRSDTPGVEISQLPAIVLNPSSLQGDRNTQFTQVLTDAQQHTKTPGVRWDHLIYAYMIENTRIYEIFRRVVNEFLHGEKFGAPSEETQLWLRNSEELFYRDTPSFSITTLDSYLRPDLRSTRRNAYYRMFGMDLNHGGDDNQPYPYTRAEAANNGFVSTFEEFLREVWIGYINRSTTSGANPTDEAKIHELTDQLKDMLITRRLKGNLSREEFFFVAMMSWFHLTVEYNLPIIDDLRAQATSPDQQLFKIAQMVGLPAHGLSRSYFEIADAISSVLIYIESGAVNSSSAARVFYDPIISPLLSDAMNKIITHWSVITGHDIKAGKVSVK